MFTSAVTSTVAASVTSTGRRGRRFGRRAVLVVSLALAPWSLSPVGIAPATAAYASVASPAGVAAGREDAVRRLVDLSSVRQRIRNMPLQAGRLIEPYWHEIGGQYQPAVPMVLAEVYDEAALTELVRSAMVEMYDARHAEEAIEWLASPVAFEMKFAEVTQWRNPVVSRSELASELSRLDRKEVPQERLRLIERLIRAVDATGAALDISAELGVVAAGFARGRDDDGNLRPRAVLEKEIDAERRDAKVRRDYERIVKASLLHRFHEIRDEDLEAYVAFAESKSGRWFHASMQRALRDALHEVATGFDASLASHARGGRVETRTPDLIDLPSGRTLRLLGLGPVRLGTAGERFLAVRYQTDLALDDDSGLRREILELWNEVESDTGDAPLPAVFFEAAAPMHGILRVTGRSRVFTLRRDESGEWELRGPDEDPTVEKVAARVRALRDSFENFPP